MPAREIPESHVCLLSGTHGSVFVFQILSSGQRVLREAEQFFQSGQPVLSQGCRLKTSVNTAVAIRSSYQLKSPPGTLQESTSI